MAGYFEAAKGLIPRDIFDLIGNMILLPLSIPVELFDTDERTELTLTGLVEVLRVCKVGLRSIALSIFAWKEVTVVV